MSSCSGGKGGDDSTVSELKAQGVQDAQEAQGAQVNNVSVNLTIDQLREQFENAGQGHVFRFYDANKLSKDEQDAFVQQLKNIVGHVDISSLSDKFNPSPGTHIDSDKMAMSTSTSTSTSGPTSTSTSTSTSPTSTLTSMSNSGRVGKKGKGETTTPSEVDEPRSSPSSSSSSSSTSSSSTSSSPTTSFSPVPPHAMFYSESLYRGNASVQSYSSTLAHRNSPQRQNPQLQNSSIWRHKGLQAIASGRVAVVVLAGGQGTRLGFDGPKGMFSIGLPSGKSLFELQCHQLQRLCRIVEETFALEPGTCPSIPYYVMTSPLNHSTTVSFFEEHQYFGMEPEKVHFFTQGALPCLTADEGKIILENKYTIATAPDGNGGVYTALHEQGHLSEMKANGIRYLHIVSIDNALVKVADPVLIGCSAMNDAQVANKTVPKAAWNEAVGVMALRNGKMHVVEYSEIDEVLAKAVDDTTGKLLFGSANICNHLFSIDFLTNTVIPSLSSQAHYHLAKKAVPYADPDTGETIREPQVKNAVKLELFIFDVLPFAEKAIVLETPRSSEFAPVKNATGQDSPATALERVVRLHRRWLEQAGGVLFGPDHAACEISPLISYEGEGLHKLLHGLHIQLPVLFRLSPQEVSTEESDSQPIPIPNFPRLQSRLIQSSPFSVIEVTTSTLSADTPMFSSSSFSATSTSTSSSCSTSLKATARNPAKPKQSSDGLDKEKGVTDEATATGAKVDEATKQVAKRLSEVDLEETTPTEALELLSDLQSSINTKKTGKKSQEESLSS